MIKDFFFEFMIKKKSSTKWDIKRDKIIVEWGSEVLVRIYGARMENVLCQSQ